MNKRLCNEQTIDVSIMIKTDGILGVATPKTVVLMLRRRTFVASRNFIDIVFAKISFLFFFACKQFSQFYYIVR